MGYSLVMRVERLIHGNPGSHRNLTHGVAELKIEVGPGYRVYYTQKGDRLLLLLAGGDKSTQQRDINLAIELAQACQDF
jgi:putative addiction module killer protein